MGKYYYENVLANQNITAKANIAWVADITEIELDKQKKLYIFLCVDIHSNNIIASNISRKILLSSAIVKSLSKAIEKRFLAKPIQKVIVHTDRGTQFSSKTYNNFIRHVEKLTGSQLFKNPLIHYSPKFNVDYVVERLIIGNDISKLPRDHLTNLW